MRPLLLLPLFVAACSSSNPTYPTVDGDAGADASVAPAQGSASVVIVPGANGSASCPVALPDNTWEAGGTGGVVRDGAAEQGDTVLVSCRVAPKPDGTFDVTGAVEKEGKGSIAVKGTVSLDASGTLQGTYALAGGLGQWTENDCTYTFVVSGGVAAGRLWIDLVCPKASDASHGTVCDAEAQIRLENCGQE